MNEQPCPVDGRRGTAPHAGEVDLLKQVADIVRQAEREYQGGHPIAGRLEIVQAKRVLDRAFHGEAV